MKIILLFLINIFIHNSSFAQVDSIQYHDNQMESQWGSSSVNDSFGCFVRFTPSSYPVQLTGVRGYFRNPLANSIFKWKVLIDPSGSANGGVSTIYLSPSPLVNPAANGSNNQQYDLFTDLSSDSIIITSGDFYLGAVQTLGYFGMGIDMAPDDSIAISRQWTWMTVFGNDYWNTISNQAYSGQFGITAYFGSSPVGISSTEKIEDRIFLTSDGKIIVFLHESNFNEVEIYDLSGKILFNYSFQSNENITDINFLSNGIYLIKIRNEKGNIIRKLFKNQH